jgi:nucleotide-binding universal stress UspA family protein
VLEGFPGESVYSGSGAFRLIGEYWARVEKAKRELRALVPLEALNWCEVDTEAVSGIPHGSILAVALARNADLVVVGSPRRTRLDRILMASTVAGVLRRARCAVLAVPEISSVTETVARPTTDRKDADRAVAGLA